MGSQLMYQLGSLQHSFDFPAILLHNLDKQNIDQDKC